ncbi:MBG domain-containing protein [Levilactobacillus fujinensis]|uniref:MBG domain-containing protein n=1 Tax=Levilactobacillus fujinensis TaxID=2486024 RepID=A0ABW1TF33_9LACO|nr:MBG domain-containing protein [Levilactobacillus fujinensis]
MVAVAGKPVLVQIPGYTPTQVVLAAPTNGDKIANDTLAIDQTATNPDTTTTTDTATPVNHYYTTTGKTVDGKDVTTAAAVTVGTGQSITTDLNQQPLTDTSGDPVVSGGKTVGSSDYYWSDVGNATATDSTDKTQPQTSGSLLLPTAATLDYWEQQATANQAKADDYNTRATTMYKTFTNITGLTQAQIDAAKALLSSVSEIYTGISKQNGIAKADFEAAKLGATADTIYNDGQNGYAALQQVQDLLTDFELDLSNLATTNKDAASSLITFNSWGEDYGEQIGFPTVAVGPDFGVSVTAEQFNNPAYFAYFNQKDPDGAAVIPKSVGNYMFKLTDAGRAYLKSLNSANTQIGLYVSAMLKINPLETAATIDAATVDYGGDGTTGSWPTFTGSLGSASTKLPTNDKADHQIVQSDFEVIDEATQKVVAIKDLQVNGKYTIRYTAAAQAALKSDANYKFTSFGTATLTVKPRAISVTAQDHGKTYGTADDPTLDLTSDSADGLVNGDTVDGLGVKLIRTAGENAGHYDITLDAAKSALDSNYDITVNKGTFTIAQLPVTVAAKPMTKAYGDTDQPFALEDAKLPDGYTLTKDDVTLTRTTGETVGDYAITGSAVDTSNYAVTVTPGTLTIAPREITVDVGSQTKTYGDADQPFTWEVDQESLAPNDTKDSLDFTLSRETGNNVNANGYAITGTSANKNYLVKVNAGTLTIDPRAVTVQADNKTKTYGENDPKFTGSLDKNSKLAYTETLDDLGLNFSRQDLGQNVGKYDITGSATNGNYTVTVTPGNLEIKPLAITLKADDVTKKYGDADPAFTATVDPTKLAYDDNLASLGLNLTRENTSSNVGEYDITGTATNKNYDVTVTKGILTITQRAVTVDIGSQHKVYGAADESFSYQVGPTPVTGDTLNVKLSRTKGEDVGQYDITGTTNNQNYAVTVNKGTLTVTKRPVTVIADNQRKAYGTTEPNYTWQVSADTPLVNGDATTALTVDLSRVKDENSGRYAITGTGTSQNYDVTVVAGDLLIDPRVVAVTIANQEKTYGNPDPDLTWSLSADTPLADGEQPADLKMAVTREPGEDVNSYVISGKSMNTNYTVKVTNGTFKILPRNISVVIDNQRKVYGADNPQYTWQVDAQTPLVADDTLNVITTRTAGEDVGNYAITGTVDSRNYNVVFSNGSLRIDPRVVAVTIDDATKTYGDSDQPLTWKLGTEKSLAPDEQSTALQMVLSRATGETVGKYTITGHSENKNYTVEVTNGTLTIVPRNVSVIIDNQRKVYGTDDAAYVWRISNTTPLQLKDKRADLQVVLTRDRGENVGRYRITGTFDNSNYKVTITNGTLTIDPRVVAVTIDPQTKIYGNSDPKPTYQLAADSQPLAADQTLADLALVSSRQAGENVATYTTTASSKNNNYTVVVTDGKLTITPRALSVIIVNQRKVYGDTDPTNTWQIADETPLKLTDTRNDLNVVLKRVAGETSGRYAITGTSNNVNYAVAFTKADLLIDPRPVNVTVANQQKVYGNSNPELTWQIDANTPLAADQQPVDLHLQLSCGTATNVGTYTISGTASNPNFVVTVTNGMLTVTKRHVTVIADNQSKIYGDTDRPLTLTNGKDVVVNGDTEAALGVTLTRKVGEDSGTYVIDGAVNSQNYAVTVTPGTFTIKKRVVTVTAGSQLKTYGESDPTLTLSDSDKVLVNHDNESALGVTLTRVAGENTSTYAITGSAASQNYQVTVTPGTLGIVKRVVTVTVADQTKKFGQSDPTLTLVDPSQQLVRGDKETALGVELTRQSGETVGTYEITGTATNQNYTTVVLPGKLTINPADAQVRIDDAKVVYGNMPTFTGRFSFLRFASNFALSDLEVIDSQKQVVAVADLQAGDYTVQLTKQAQDSLVKKNPNYKFTTFSLGQLSVAKRSVTVQVANREMYAGHQSPENQVELIAGSLANDKPGLDLQYVEPDSKAVGTYAIGIVTNNPNYAVKVIPGQLKVLGKAIDSAGNVTITEKDPDGHVVKIDKHWRDGSQTTYDYDPTTGKRTVHEQKDGKDVDQQVITPESAKATLTDGGNTVSVVTLDPVTQQPTFDHYTTEKTVDSAGNVTNTTKDATDNVVKVTKQWQDGSGTTFTYDPSTGKRTVTEQKDGKTVDQQTLAPGESKVTLPDGAGGETTVNAGQPGAQPTFDHYTTTKDIDIAGNVTTTTKDAAGNIVNVTKQWTDGSGTTYTYDPTTGKRTIGERKNGKTVDPRTVAPGESEVTLPDGTGGETIVKFGPSETMPTFTHYSASYDTTATNESDKIVTITKQWPDGSKVVYTYDPITGKRIISELRDGYLVEQRTIAPGSLLAILPDGMGGVTIVKFDASGTVPSFTRQTADETNSRQATSRKKVLKNAGVSKQENSPKRMPTSKAQLQNKINRHGQSPAIASAEHVRNLAGQSQQKPQKPMKRQQNELPQTGQKNESFLTALGALLLSLLVTPVVRKRH